MNVWGKVVWRVKPVMSNLWPVLNGPLQTSTFHRKDQFTKEKKSILPNSEPDAYTYGLSRAVKLIIITILLLSAGIYEILFVGWFSIYFNSNLSVVLISNVRLKGAKLIDSNLFSFSVMSNILMICGKIINASSMCVFKQDILERVRLKEF